MTATDRAIELARAAAQAAADKKAAEIIAFDVSEQLAITDVFVLCSADSQPQMNAVKDAVEERLLELGAKTLRREGEREARWILMDYGDVVVHIQHSEERAFYALERLWSDCPSIDLKLS
ncbi:ribosome silencing factor [Aeromicrobium sp. 179-A 4D2 NHS]|uniref:ribosome silencing factor n=1 Tax=Aeromicrobium sp. 179-A 4D2 NHS TaxID=3142375 RepID=UPI00399EF47D